MDYWLDLFKMVELKEIMRQKDDLSFAKVLNFFRTREIKEQTNLLLEYFREGPIEALHVFSTNEEVNRHNLTMLRRSCQDLIELNSQDYKKGQNIEKTNTEKQTLDKIKK